MKKALTIAGSDCSGGAGVQADLKTFSAHLVYGMSVITSVVAENTSRVIDFQNVSVDLIEKQLEAIFEDIIPDAIKIGMVESPEIMRAIRENLEKYQAKQVVIDPVMYAKNGCPLMRESSIDTLIKVMIPLADCLTPNIPEAEKITGMKILTLEDMENAARSIHALGAKNVLVKGGHLESAAIDILFDGVEFTHYHSKRIQTKNTHGTGCTLSSAIAANLAKGEPIKVAVSNAKEYVTGAIENALPLGNGHGPTNHFYQFERVVKL
nr:bifunctional hydroxymethylpyrimidine kinase/phosphomethylpyrimidine kinase [Pilibacter termitis]